MKEFVTKILFQVNFAEKYKEICNSYANYDKGMSFSRKQVEDTLFLGAELIYASKEKSFYKDYNIDPYTLRITITFKYGFIECFYTLWNSESEERIRGRFNSIASMQDQTFNTQVTHNFPVATSLDELEKIMKEVLKLNDEFVDQLKAAVVNNHL